MKKNKSFYLMLCVACVLFGGMQVKAQSNLVMVEKWGGFGNKPGQFKFPAMMAADKNSNLYVVDQHNHRVQKFDSQGNFITMWGKAG